ncbi:tRNA lysidine(34) synthetase TilS [Dyadobacter sp. CY345]|uniref:tRNA lysidine(34) synthetase TilS n=1 Tax=Dyadobacter sp. CY345 TaxID=2909335 RepID=UPI001F313DD1|nr:tRNA lysidine(34) synthetase TilS [Dyadobacter sp. CY345]MCF2447400.1 tRNA lysidine(34) synthetase TilS [Dyadobacter sp. CY345]
MLEAFLTFINQQKFDLHKKSTLLTVSGGMDSVVLAHLFHQAGFEAGIAHCNFGLRGEESNEDEVFVRHLAATYKFPFYVKHFSTKGYAKEEGISTQMAARDLRYRWFDEIKNENDYNWIATAHHANDSFETVILNLVRGTGLAGMHGIAAQNNVLIRPLMFASREEIYEYVKEYNLSWREDSSNSSTHYKRNLIRHEVMPVLKTINPSLESTFKTTSERMRSAENLVSFFLNDWKEEAVRKEGEEYYISISSLLMSSEPKYRLWFILQDFGFSYAQSADIYTSAEGSSGKVFYSETHQILKDRDYFIISKMKSDASNLIEISRPSGEYQMGDVVFLLNAISNIPDLTPGSDKSMAYLNLDKLEFPLSIRSWEKGDSFCPFGMAGKRKKVSDLMIDLKLSLNEKQKVKVLVNKNGDIVWVVGFRLDDRYKVVKEATEILLITQQLNSAAP